VKNGWMMKESDLYGLKRTQAECPEENKIKIKGRSGGGK
jgi:hypothetical protein